MALQTSISDVLITKFSDTVFKLAQQTQARTRPLCEFQMVDAEQLLLDRIGSTEVQDLNERFAEIVPNDIQWDRRRLAATRFGLPLFVDKWDEDRMLANPQSELAVRAAQALERKLDRIALAALNAQVLTGRNGTVPVSAATDGVVTSNFQGGFTYESLLALNAQFASVEIGTESTLRKFLLISEVEHQALMKEGMLLSGDFSNQYAVDKGKMVRALDFEIIVFGSGVPIPMLQVANGVRTCFAVAQGAVKIGMTQSWEIDVEKRTDRWKTTQVLASGIAGGVRMEGARVIAFQTTAVGA